MPCPYHLRHAPTCAACQAVKPIKAPRPVGRPVGFPSPQKVHADDAARARAHYIEVVKPRREAATAARKAAQAAQREATKDARRLAKNAARREARKKKKEG